MSRASQVLFSSEDLVPSDLAPSRWSTELLPARIELLTCELDTEQLSELGAIGFAAEIRHAARIGAAAAVSHATPQLDDVVVIGGLFRTGTTLLHDLLASTLPRRVIRGWEALDPTRASDPAARASAVEDARRRFRAAAAVAPRLASLHRLDADGVEECSPLLAHSLACAQWGLMIHCPSYVDWLLSTRHVDAYHLWRAQLAMIDDEATRWLLKSPMHMIDYESLLRMVPTARVIHIRRGVVDVVTSFLNLCMEVRRVFASDLTDTSRELGAFWLPRLVRLLDRAEADLDRIGLQPICVDYDDLVTNTGSALASVLEVLGDDVVNEQRLPLPPHRRTELFPLEAFGLDQRQVETALADHIEGRFLKS